MFNNHIRFGRAELLQQRSIRCRYAVSLTAEIRERNGGRIDPPALPLVLGASSNELVENVKIPLTRRNMLS